MDIEMFRRQCIEKKAVKTERLEAFDKMIIEQEQYDVKHYVPKNMRCYVPKTRFSWKKLWWVRICPACEKELTKETVGICYHIDTTFRRIIFTCDCGYKYAVEECS